MINSNNESNVSSVIAPIEESGSSSCVGQRLSRIRTPSRRQQESNEGALRSRRMATVTTDPEELNNRRDEYVNRVESEANEFINKDAKKYKKVLEKLTKFVLCGICGVDDCITKMVSYEKARNHVEACVELKVEYNRLTNLKNEYSAKYVQCVKNAFNEFGVLKYAEYVCNYCFNKTKLKSKSGENDECDKDEDIAISNEAIRDEIDDFEEGDEMSVEMSKYTILCCSRMYYCLNNYCTNTLLTMQEVLVVSMKNLK